MSYVQGFVIPVPHAKREAYRAMAEAAWPIFRDYGAERVVECWGDSVPDGEKTDFRRAVAATAEENVVFSWIVWPSKEVHDAAQAKMPTDDRMQMPDEMPFDPARMIYGGFVPIVDLQG